MVVAGFPVLTLLRTGSTPDGVFGHLRGIGRLELHTCEDDWRDNAGGQSCVPAGTYQLRRTVYYKHGYETFEVCNVPNRERCLIHPGNTEEDTEGCILLGLRLGRLWVPDEDMLGNPRVQKRAVVASREAFRSFMEYMGSYDEALLKIEWAEGAMPRKVAA